MPAVEPADGSSPISRFTTMPVRQRAVVAGVLIAALVAYVAATNIDRGTGSVDLLPEQRAVIESLAADGRCADLQVLIDDAETDRGVPFTDRSERAGALIHYTRVVMGSIGCTD